MRHSNLLRFLLFLTKKNRHQGFTLVELLVVIIIMGVLAAIAVPNFIRQAGKAREVEIKNTVGTINRAQQIYHWEKQVYATGSSDAIALSLLGVSFNNQYIDTYNIVDSGNYVTVAPQNVDYLQDQTRAYSGGTFYINGVYSTIICQGFEVSDAVLQPTSLGTCNTDSEELR